MYKIRPPHGVKEWFAAEDSSVNGFGRVTVDEIMPYRARRMIAIRLTPQMRDSNAGPTR